jgi:arsenate reductase
MDLSLIKTVLQRKYVLAVVFAFVALTKPALAQEKKIIFVCQHGAAKSVIAASYFNKIASERNLAYTAECRGIEPDSAVSPGAREGLTKDDLFNPDIKPQKLLPRDAANVERIILFAPLPADLRSSVKTEDWSKIENIDADYSKRRDAIVKKINELLDNLEKEK